MDLTYVLVMYAIFVIMVYYLLYKYGLRPSAALVIAAVFGQLLLNILKPPPDVTGEESQMTSSLMFYLSIQFLTPIMTMIYAVGCAFKNKRYGQN